MKNCVKFLVFMLAVIMSFALVACSGKTDDTTASNETKDLAGEEGDVYVKMDYMSEELGEYIKLGQYTGLEIKLTRPTVSDEDIENELLALVGENMKYEPYEENITDRATVAGDLINIDYVGTIDGEAFEGGSNQGDSVVLAENNGYIDWFEDDLYGVMPGTTVKTTGYFPDDYHEHLAGKEVTFEITVNYIAGHYDIPELNDEFIKEKTDLESVEEYRQFVRENLQAALDAEYENSKMQTMWEMVLENTETISLPEGQVMYYYTSERSYYEMYAEQYGMTYEDFMVQMVGASDEMLMEYIESIVKDELVFYSIVKAEGITVSDTDYAEGLARYAAQEGISEAEFEEMYAKEAISESILWEKLIEYLASQNTFVEE